MALPRRLSNVDELPPGLELRERHLLELALLAPRLAPALSLLAAFVSDETVGDVNKLEVQVGDEAVEALRRALGNRDINVDDGLRVRTHVAATACVDTEHVVAAANRRREREHGCGLGVGTGLQGPGLEV